jgi:hypothetical protein
MIAMIGTCISLLAALVSTIAYWSGDFSHAAYFMGTAIFIHLLTKDEE